MLILWLLSCSYCLTAGNSEINRLRAEISNTGKEDTSQIALLNRLTRLYWQQNLDSAILTARKALDIAERLKDSGYIFKCCALLGTSYGMQGNYLKAVEVFQTARKKIPAGNHEERLINLNQLGTAYLGLGNFDEAEKRFKDGLRMAEQQNDSFMLRTISQNLGNLYGMKGAVAMSASYYYTALRLAEHSKDSIAIGQINMNLGNLYMLLGDFNKSLQSNLKALEIVSRFDNPAEQTLVYNNIGICYAGLLQHSKALEYYKKAMKSALQTGQKEELAKIYTNTGFSYTEKGSFDSAYYYLEKSNSLLNQIGAQSFLTSNYQNFAAYYYKLNNYNNSIYYAEKAFRLADKYQILSELEAGAEHLYLSYRQLHNFPEALKYHELYKTYSDSIKSFRNQNQIEIERQDHALERKNKEIALLQKENLIKTKTNQLQKNYLIAGAIIAALILFSVVVFYRQSRLQARLNKALQLKNKEVAFHLARLKELNQLKDKVIAVMSHDVKSPVASLHAVLDLVAMKEITSKELPAIIGQLSQSTHNVSILLENILGWVSTQLQNSDSLEYETVFPGEAAGEVVKLYKPIAELKNLKIKNLIPDSIFIETHKNSLSLILRNLVSNAVKFSYPDQTVEIFAKPENAGIMISVKDSGTGMSEEEISRLFNPDKLYSKNGTQKEKGTGLGLMFVKDSIEVLGGKMHIQTGKGSGTVLSFWLPADVGENPEKHAGSLFAVEQNILLQYQHS